VAATARPRELKRSVLIDLVKRILFVCSQNRLRSPTAEQVFSGRAALEVTSAGLNNSATVMVSAELIEWADIIFVMEKSHRNKISKKFKLSLRNKRVICLDTRDEYAYMDQELVALLEERVKHFIRDT
jgi:predicted protein tyrosine phosphatase